MLKVINLHKEFENTIAIDNINFEISEGEIFGLLGPNGAGKTTTIRCLLGILKPERGEIFFNGIQNHNIKDIVGYLPEERGLYTKSRVIDVLQYLGELKGKPKTFIRDRVHYYLKKLKIENYANRKVNELSKGNQQKIQIISALIPDPKILILDEPFAGLDPINQELAKNLISEFLSEGKIIILSTHQMDLAEKLCHRILLMNKGKEIIYGSLSELKKKFGTLTLHIKGKNLDQNLKSFPEFELVDIYENYAEIYLSEKIEKSNNSVMKEIIQKLIQRYEITSIEFKEPSLHSIFIRSIKELNN